MTHEETPAAEPVDVDAVADLGRWLRATGYRFTTVTPETHRRVNARRGNEEAHALRDIFGWSRPFRDSSLPRAVLEILERGHLLEAAPGGLRRSRLRFATLDDLLLPHSAFPTTSTDSVFFGPDTYRFAGLIRRTLADAAFPHGGTLVDIGCGSGAGGLLAASLLKQSGPRIVLADISPAALRLAVASTLLAGIPRAEIVESNVLDGVHGPLDLVLCNPPYLVDASARTYRHGGSAFGTELAMRVVTQSLARLAPGGMLILYTGAPVIDGVDQFRQAVEPALAQIGASFRYDEIDPDVFGEELDRSEYSVVERIAAVGLVVRMPGGKS